MHNKTDPLDDFSVYISRRSIGDDPPIIEKSQIALPQVPVDGEDFYFKSRKFGVRGLNVTIAWRSG